MSEIDEIRERLKSTDVWAFLDGDYCSVLVVAPEDCLDAVQHFYGKEATAQHEQWFGPLVPLVLTTQAHIEKLEGDLQSHKAHVEYLAGEVRRHKDARDEEFEAGADVHIENRAEIRRLEAENARLKGFFEVVFRDIWDMGEPDGEMLQDTAEDMGLCVSSPLAGLSE